LFIDFSLGMLFELHNYERTLRGLDKLNKDIDVSSIFRYFTGKIIHKSCYTMIFGFLKMF